MDKVTFICERCKRRVFDDTHTADLKQFLEAFNDPYLPGKWDALLLCHDCMKSLQDALQDWWVEGAKD